MTESYSMPDDSRARVVGEWLAKARSDLDVVDILLAARAKAVAEAVANELRGLGLGD